MLDILGLDDVTYTVYRLWLRDGSPTLEEVAESAGHPVAVVRRARDRLVRLSLLLPSRDRPGQFLAVPPDGVLAQLLDQQHEQLMLRSEQLARARAQVSALVADYARVRMATSVGDEVERLDTEDAVRAQTIALIARSERDVVVVRTEPPSAEELAEILPAAGRAARRGVAVRAVWPPLGPAHSHVSIAFAEAAGLGVEIRLADDLHADATAVDGWLGLVALTPGKPADGALLLRAPALTTLVVTLFEQVWEDALPLETTDGPAAPAAGGSGDDPSSQERALLRLLSLGAKDEAAARHLGVSVRTVRRMIADLMRELDARSRFQAGVIAAQRGWL